MTFKRPGRINLQLAIALIFAIAFPGNCRAEEGKDHPLIKSYPDSKISKSFVRDFDEVQMPTGKSGRKDFADTITVKGKVTGIIYQNPKKRSTVEIYQNSEEAMKGRGSNPFSPAPTRAAARRARKILCSITNGPVSNSGTLPVSCPGPRATSL